MMNRKITTIILLFLVLTTTLFSYPFKAWNHNFNPALMDFRTRNFLEIGMNEDLIASQNALLLWEELPKLQQETYVLDIPKIYEHLEGEDLNITLYDETSLYGILDLSFVRLGAYANINLDGKISIPNDLMEILAYGNVEEEYKGSSLPKVDGNVDLGLYTSVRTDNFSLGVKYGLNLPVLLTDKDAKLDYELITSDASIAGSLKLSIPIYSSIHPDEIEDLQNLDQESIMNKALDAAQVLSVGFASGGKHETPEWGIAVNNITIVPGVLRYRYDISTELEYDSGNILETLLNGDETLEEPPTEDQGSEEIYTITEINKEYKPPISVSGFFSFPLLFDWTAYGEAIFSDPIGINYGLVGEWKLVEVFPIYLGLENISQIWRTSLGFGMNIYVLELYGGVSVASENFLDQYRLEGLSARLNFAIGF